MIKSKDPGSRCGPATHSFGSLYFLSWPLLRGMEAGLVTCWPELTVPCVEVKRAHCWALA